MRLWRGFPWKWLIGIEMQYRIIVNPVVIIPDQVVLSLIVMEYRAVVMPAYLRVVIGLDIPISEALRFERQRLERDIN